jgi:hypothetical protein
MDWNHVRKCRIYMPAQGDPRCGRADSHVALHAAAGKLTSAGLSNKTWIASVKFVTQP